MRNTHITDIEWTRFWQQRLAQEEQTELLAHVCNCDYCSARMADGIPKEWQLTAPVYLKQETVSYVEQNTRLPRFFSRHPLQFFTYSLKVGVAMAATLLLLLRVELPDSSFSERGQLVWDNRTTWEIEASQPNAEQEFSLTLFLNGGTRYINQKLNEFSSNLLYKEDTHHAK